MTEFFRITPPSLANKAKVVDPKLNKVAEALRAEADELYVSIEDMGDNELISKVKQEISHALRRVAQRLEEAG